ncbi:MAG: response regulator, partial [Bacteroidales bacterium]|nr:response regulator [Bacteroidales bacterium]
MKYKVLIVDDNVNNSRLIEGILMADKNEYECIFALDGEEGYEIAQNRLPDLVLMDYMMPKIDGLKCLQMFRENKKLKDTPIIMITAYKTDELFTDSFKFGAFDFVTKPLDVNELKSRIYKALGITETLKRIKNKINRYEKERADLQKNAIITQNVNNSFILCDKEGNIEWVNEGFVKLRGIGLEEHVNRHGTLIHGLSNDQKVKELLEDCMQNKEPINFIAPITEKEATVSWVQTFVTPQLSSSGDIQRLIAVETDITELKQKEQELYEQNKQMLEITENLEGANQLLEVQKKEIEEQKFQIESEQEKSERLLLNILPFEVARQLKSKGRAGTRFYRHVTVMFTDFQGFSKHIRGLEPKELVSVLDTYFAKFDEIVGHHYLEKIKTIGDAYMCAGGLPLRNNSNPVDAVLAGLEIQHFMKQVQETDDYQELPKWDVRIGLHSGAVVAGVVGKKKFAYDIWGDTVNIASRMEQLGEVGKVNISGSTHEYIKDYFDCEHRGKMEAKNVGEIDMFFVERIKPELSADEHGFIPNEDFMAL